MIRFQRIAVAVLLAVTIATPATSLAQQSFTEDFTATTYKDTLNTTADWNTVDAELKLFPFTAALVGTYDTPTFARGVAVAGTHAFVADQENGLRIVDISDPSAPMHLGTYDTPSVAVGVRVAGDHAYVADGSDGLQVIDISDPTSPTLAGAYDTPSFAWGVDVSGDHAYVADQVNGLLVIDISDPAAPTLVGTYDTAGFAFGVEVFGNHAYVADHGGGLKVIDISDPTAPTLAGAYDTPGVALAVEVAGDLAFVADGSSGLQVIDVSAPTAPVLAGSYDTPDEAVDVAVFGDVAYVADNTSGLHLLDISDPTNPTPVDAFDTAGQAAGVAISGDLALVADQTGGLKIFRVAHPASPVLQATLGLAGSPAGIDVSGDHAFVASGEGGLRVIDISTPGSPAPAGTYDTPNLAVGVEVDGDLAYVADNASGLQVIDVSDPALPTLAGTFPTANFTNGLATDGDRAYLAAGNSLMVVDISDPTTPTLTSSLNLPGTCWRVAVSGDIAVVAASTMGLQVIDISDPAVPTIVGDYDTPGVALGVAMSGDLAFVADDQSGLQVIDISDPSIPTLAGTCDTPGGAREVTVTGDRAYVGDGSDGLQVIDISNPANPTLSASFGAPGFYADAVAVAGDHAFVADTGTGLRVVQVYQREFEASANVGRSLAIDGGAESIVRARVSSTETAGIAWEMSADGGASFQPFAPGAWTRFTNPGTDLFWRTTHTWSGGNPTVSSATFDWLNDFGPIVSIADVPDDQGGWLRIDFDRSGYDFAGETSLPVTGYQVYRRVDDPVAKSQVLEKGAIPPDSEIAGTSLASFDPGSLRTLGDRTFLVGEAKAQGEFPPGTWELLSFHAASQQDAYTVVVPTLADSTVLNGTTWSVHFVTTHTTTPSVWFASQPDSGYSVDNIAPGVPSALVAGYQAGGVSLDWDDAPESDFQYHRIYRGTSPDFEPAPENLVHETASSGWTDDMVDPWGYFYKVTTLDHAGNESEAAAPSGVTGVDSGALPSRTALLGASPNPFNPSTKLSFELAAPSRARLKVYDAAGRLVATLVDEARTAGRHEVTWDGRDDAGRQAASGVYLYRLEAGATVQTKRMTLVK